MMSSAGPESAAFVAAAADAEGAALGVAVGPAARSTATGGAGVDADAGVGLLVVEGLQPTNARRRNGTYDLCANMAAILPSFRAPLDPLPSDDAYSLRRSARLAGDLGRGRARDRDHPRRLA